MADEDAERLRRIAQLIGAETLEEAIRFLLKLAEERGVSLTCGRDSLSIIRRALRHAKDAGPTNASRLDDYIYGVCRAH